MTTDARGRPRVSTTNEEASRTIQSDRDRADIRHILKRHGALGIFENLNQTEAQFADVSEFTDYADLMRNVRAAELEFRKLPAKVRRRFDNDISKYLDAAHDEEKRLVLEQELADEKAKEGPAPTPPATPEPAPAPVPPVQPPAT